MIVRDDPLHPDPNFVELYRRLPDVDDPEPWLGWARRAGGPVLYLGAGTGRLAVPLERAGIELVLVDSHPGMLERLGDRLPAVERIRSRIEDLALDRRFRLVIVPANVLCTQERLQRAVQHVQAGGRLAFQLMNPHWLAAGAAPSVKVLACDRQRAHIQVRYAFEDITFTQDADVALVWPEEIDAFLAPARLRLESMRPEQAGDLDASPTFYVVARRRSAAAGG